MVTRRILFLILIFCIGHSEVAGQNKKAQGYMGLWYSFGEPGEYGYKFSGGLATFSSQHNPMAVFSPEAQKTFFVYCGTSSPDSSHLQIMISYFDHQTHRVPKPVIVYDKLGVKDPQDNATLSIDAAGYIWVFISGWGRTRPGHIFKSVNPWSIETFQMKYEGEMLFPQAWWIKGKMMLMHSKSLRGRELYWATGQDGTQWEPSQKLAGMGGHFQITNVFGDRIYSIFNYCPKGNLDLRTNLYLVYSDDVGKTWRNIDGQLLVTPLTEPRCQALVRDFISEKKLVYIQDLNFDEAGNPVILILVSNDSHPGPKGDPREWMVVHRKDNNWQFSKVCDMPNNYNDGSIYTAKDEWRIIGPSEPGPSRYSTGGEMVLWISRDEGTTWEKSLNVTTGSKFHNSYSKRPFNPHKDFYAFWADGDPDKKSESRLYFTNEKCDGVWVLPYRMNKDSGKPARVR